MFSEPLVLLIQSLTHKSLSLAFTAHSPTNQAIMPRDKTKRRSALQTADQALCPMHIQDRRQRIRGAANAKARDASLLIVETKVKMYMEEKEADALTDEHRAALAAMVTPDRAIQALTTTVSLTDLGLDTKLGLEAMRHLQHFVHNAQVAGRSSVEWPGTFESGLVAIRFTASMQTAMAIVAAIGPMAPHMITTTTHSGRVSRRVDPSSLLVNKVFVRGSGCVGRYGFDSTESKRTQQQPGTSYDVLAVEAYDDEFLGLSRSR
jgi:hypothetical protein